MLGIDANSHSSAVLAVARRVVQVQGIGAPGRFWGQDAGGSLPLHRLQLSLKQVSGPS